MSKIVFLHIPKTGGTSVHDFLVNQFDRQDVLPDRFNTLREHSEEHLDNYKYFSGHYDFNGVKRIPGDKKIFTFMRDPKERILSLYYFWKSHTNEHIEKHNLQGPRLAKKMNLLDFLCYKENGIPANIDNSIARVFLGEMYCGPNQSFLYPEEQVLDIAKSNIDDLFCIGFMDDYEKSYKEVIKKLGFNSPSVIPHSRKENDKNDPSREFVKKEPLTEEINEELNRLVRFDQKIYEYCKEKFS
ncbi:sulfotransferase family 2 domain-containing protein [Vreelandella neptunia]|uniref:Sulfotransferase family protein n=1 Tax=Vreelandella neptunia TaxID=115551 RepID=A0ABS9S1N8_9GAMM|nr:sulfotransferase family 2 domain-containing protein [Halomonas neptunia]MCH4810010.1 sulfotransferase family protein [Halomonas neptunia]